MFDCFNDCSLSFVEANINLIWNIYICHEICLSIYDDLSNRNTTFHAYFGYESIYQCTRLFNGRYVFGFDWCHYEFSARPNIYFPVWAWHSRRCHRNPHFSMCFSYLCVLVFKESFGIKSKITKKRGVDRL